LEAVCAPGIGVEGEVRDDHASHTTKGPEVAERSGFAGADPDEEGEDDEA
jgi:hypothetical protein